MSECTALSTVGFVQLNRGFTALVDANDLPLVTRSTWHASPSKTGTWYAPGMHRLLCPDAGEIVDHINGRGCDNRRSNLRPATNSQNHYNSRKPVKSWKTHSRYKGVTKTTIKGWTAWQVKIRTKGKRLTVGYFHNEEDAARAYDRAAVQHHGEFARLNFPHEQRQGV
jgi:hypothetical protein